MQASSSRTTPGAGSSPASPPPGMTIPHRQGARLRWRMIGGRYLLIACEFGERGVEAPGYGVVLVSLLSSLVP
jgi:hypothetical protein